MQPVKIGIVGLGNIGRVLGVIFSAKGYSVEAVTGLGSSRKEENYAKYSIDGDFGSLSYLVRVLDSVEEMSHDLDVIFICTKSYLGSEILPIAKKKIKADGTIVTIQNNFWIDRVARSISAKNSVCMYLDFACQTIRDTTYVQNYDGVKLGIYHKDAYDKLCSVHDLLSNICKVKDTNDFIGFSLGRNIINVAISALGAISGLNLKGILDDRNGRYLFVKMIEEEVMLFDHFKVNILPYDDKLDYYDFVDQSFKGKMTRRRILKLLRKNNGNVQSSALRDLENNKKSELFDLMESFISHARHHGVEIPYVCRIYEMLREIESRNRGINENAFYDKKLIEIERRKK